VVATVDPCRQPSALDAAAERHLDALVTLDPIAATVIGLPGDTGALTDFSPAGHVERAAHARRLLAELDGLPVVDAVDRVTAAALRERLGADLALHEAGCDYSALNNVASPVQSIREVFDIAPATTVTDWELNLRRLRGVADALDGVRESLHKAVADGHRPARRQVEAVAEQAAEFGAPDGFFDTLVSGAQPVVGPLTDGGLAGDLRRAAAEAAAAYTGFARWVREDLLPVSSERDAVGRDLYPLYSRGFLGTSVDLDETYAWGLAEVAETDRLMVSTARRIVPDAPTETVVEAAIEALDADPARAIDSPEALRTWMQDLSDRAIAELADSHFVIPEPLRTLTCRLAPSTSGAIYYTPPTDDLSRPGQMWWAVPRDMTRFATWRETSTVYHEGVPGHHLQMAGTISRRGELNRWRRLGCWVSGHGEGWALYAERLMAELGYLEDPGDLLGQLDAQALRAARVVVDIGVHCGLRAPAEVGGGIWDADRAWRYLRAHTRLPESTLRFELDRYLGWPGQAPSYKIGERVWLDLRRVSRERRGRDFDLRSFHQEALAVGSVGLDVLRDALLAGPGAER
jgi:uncharacterized protein (DUF885 family)